MSVPAETSTPMERLNPGPAPGWRKRLPRFERIAAVLSLLGCLALTYVLGAAAMHFGWPGSNFLSRAFLGAEAWGRAPVSEPPGELKSARVTKDRPGKAFDGFTLYTTSTTPDATLIDMHGRVVHRWKMPVRRSWPRAPGVREPAPDESVHWERCHLHPNGDVLALCCGQGSPYGYAVARFDRDSNLLWAYSGDVHHDLDVGEDGRIYVLADRQGSPAPPELGLNLTPAVVDELLVLSPEGKLLDTLPLRDAFQASDYFLTLGPGSASGTGGAPGQPPPPPGLPPGPPGPPSAAPSAAGDLFHANSVKVLTRALAPKFPQFKPGQILVSLRTPSVLAVLDLPSRKVVWAARGVWGQQHDAHFLDNGRLLLFDNLGAPDGSRVLEYDPVTQSLPWFYSGAPNEPFRTVFRGAAQRLPNGNTLTVNSEGLALVEVTPGREVVWQWAAPTAARPAFQAPPASGLTFTGARRYAPEALTFLKGTPHARPR